MRHRGRGEKRLSQIPRGNLLTIALPARFGAFKGKTAMMLRCSAVNWRRNNGRFAGGVDQFFTAAVGNQQQLRSRLCKLRVIAVVWLRSSDRGGGRALREVESSAARPATPSAERSCETGPTSFTRNERCASG